jgi:hypothetical protein
MSRPRRRLLFSANFQADGESAEPLVLRACPRADPDTRPAAADCPRSKSGHDNLRSYPMHLGQLPGTEAVIARSAGGHLLESLRQGSNVIGLGQVSSSLGQILSHDVAEGRCHEQLDRGPTAANPRRCCKVGRTRKHGCLHRLQSRGRPDQHSATETPWGKFAPEPAARVSIGTLYILDDGSDVAMCGHRASRPTFG